MRQIHSPEAAARSINASSSAMLSTPRSGGVRSVLHRRVGMLVAKIKSGSGGWGPVGRDQRLRVTPPPTNGTPRPAPPRSPPMTTRQIAPSQRDARRFVPRHIGPSPSDVQQMLDVLGVTSLDALIDATVPESIRLRRPLAIPAGLSENEALNRLRLSAQKNQMFRSYLGLGYAGCLTPAVIQRNVLENPGWYTAYTPYQAEIAQGRLEALLNSQTVIIDLTGLGIANASLPS